MTGAEVRSATHGPKIEHYATTRHQNLGQSHEKEPP
jgi:hypothetical protein